MEITRLTAKLTEVEISRYRQELYLSVNDSFKPNRATPDKIATGLLSMRMLKQYLDSLPIDSIIKIDLFTLKPGYWPLAGRLGFKLNRLGKGKFRKTDLGFEAC